MGYANAGNVNVQAFAIFVIICIYTYGYYNLLKLRCTLVGNTQVIPIVQKGPVYHITPVENLY